MELIYYVLGTLLYLVLGAFFLALFPKAVERSNTTGEHGFLVIIWIFIVAGWIFIWLFRAIGWIARLISLKRM